MANVEFVVTFLLFIQRILAAEWSYSGSHGPQTWQNTSPACALNRQSPVDIHEGDVKPYTVTDPFVFTNYDAVLGVTMTLENNGHSAAVLLRGDTAVTVIGGGLPPGVYRALQFHFHWGPNSNTGSEHLINSESYPMELHIVHMNTLYANISVAMSHADGLAVLGFMFQESPNVNNNNYASIVNGLSQIRASGTETTIPTTSLDSLLPTHFENFYRYPGSLTTPPCAESVTWTIFQDPISISSSQLQAFRTLLDSHSHTMVGNYRPVQEMHSRTVQANFNPIIHWTYITGNKDASNWNRYYANCGGSNQSPINIQASKSRIEYQDLNFRFHNYDRTTSAVLTLRNNGHTAQIDIASSNIGISGGGLVENYQASHIQFHWGSRDEIGSEHKLDGKAYPLEMQIVHFKKSLNSLTNASVVPNGLAVIAVLFEISSTDNQALIPIINSLARIRDTDSTWNLNDFILNSIMPQNKDDVYRYNGSLTTPGCMETVIWTVFRKPSTISISQLNAFRGLRFSQADQFGTLLPMVNNFRPVQQINQRIVIRNFPIVPKEAKWSYVGKHGPNHWYEDYPVCKNEVTSLQSPIDFRSQDIKFSSIAQFSSNFKTATGFTLTMKNNGHTVQIDIVGGNITITNGGLEQSYKTGQLHFHWGSGENTGSEHTINGKAYPMEMHIVHYKSIYKDVLTASTHPKGLAVLGFLYEVTNEDNPAYNGIVNKLNEIKGPKTYTSIQITDLSSLLPDDIQEFYRYDGSLTTPACNESVIWTVFKNNIKISRSQLNVFRTLLSSDVDEITQQHTSLVNNYRPIQNTNNRPVLANFHVRGAGGATTIIISARNVIIFSLLVALYELIY